MSIETASGDRTGSSQRSPAFSHQALLYEDADGFLAGTVPFLHEGFERDEAAMVAVTQRRRQMLEAELGPERDLVEFVEMESLGANPGRIIPAWKRFVERHVSPGRSARGIGEPIWPGRDADELSECRRHEALLNHAFADAPAWQLLCPYDARSLDDDTLQCACHTHPHFARDDGLLPSADYLAPSEAPSPLAGELAEPWAPVTVETSFDVGRLAGVRALVASEAAAAGLRSPRSTDLVLAVDELASNSLCYGGGAGRLRIWREPGRLICEVRDTGRIFDPLVGRVEPLPRQPRGRGLWIVNSVCDLVQLRSGPPTVVRVHMRVH